MRVRALVLSDTHLGLIGRDLPKEVLRAAEQSDVILHAGDILVASVLVLLGECAPTHAVLGNNDHDLVGELPERLQLDVAGVAVALVHDSGAAVGRASRLRRWFPEASLVVFGHSHQPLDEIGFEGQRLFNPGSPTERRRAPTHTYGLIDFADGAVVRSRHLSLGG